MCSNGWLAEYDDIGILCRHVYQVLGPFCNNVVNVPNDSLAECRDNVWHNETYMILTYVLPHQTPAITIMTASSLTVKANAWMAE